MSDSLTTTDSVADAHTIAPAADAVMTDSAGAPTELHASTEAAPHAESKAGIPQLDASTFASQIFWLVVVFVAMVMLLSRHYLPRLQGIIASRQNKIQGDLDVAAASQQKAEGSKDFYETTMKQAREHAQTTMAAVHASVKEVADKKHAELDLILKNKVEESSVQLEKMTQDALANLKPVAHDMTSVMVEKLVAARPNADQVAAIIDALEKHRGA